MIIYRHEEQEKRIKPTGPRPGFPELRAKLWPMFRDYLEGRKLNASLARVNGWYPAWYKSAPRAIIPCSNSAGVPYFQGRDMSGQAELRYASPWATREDSIVLVWPEGEAKGCVIVEGPTDALAAADIGFLGIGVMGNSPPMEVIEHVATFARAFAPVIIVPDIDTLDLGPAVLCGLGQLGIAGMILNPYAKDLAAMTPKERKQFIYV